VIDKIKFIREAHFVEDNVAPALKLVGDVSGVLNSDKIIYAENKGSAIRRSLSTRRTKTIYC